VSWPVSAQYARFSSCPFSIEFLFQIGINLHEAVAEKTYFAEVLQAVSELLCAALAELIALSALSLASPALFLSWHSAALVWFFAASE